MGRYYNGDIEGKFWFAVQSSDAPSRFGGYEHQPNYINYGFDEDTLKEVEEEIKKIENGLGQNENLLDKFFKENNGYNDEMLITFFKENNKEETKDTIHDMLREYADLGLGKQIRDCIKEQGYCNFEAEC
jgi:hypothetical protein